MRVLIDTTPARLAPHSGTGIYLTQLIAALREAGGVEVLSAENPRRRRPAGGGLGSARNLAADLWWWRIGLPRLARRDGADVVHHPLPPLLLPAAIDLPRQVVTLHDLAFERLPECFDPRWRRIAHLTHRRAARRAAAVVAVSHTTAEAARELWGVQCRVALHGPGQLTHSPAPPLESPRHFLYVGDAEPRKNLPALLAAHAAYRTAAADPLPLVLAGAAARRAPAPGLVLHPAPGPAALAELLAGAAALVQPSRYEGFGLTALEAMAAGVPVLAARVPALTEVCAGAAMYALPGDTSTWLVGLQRLAGDAALRAELREAGLRRAAAFSWAASARDHLAAYSLAVESG